MKRKEYLTSTKRVDTGTIIKAILSLTLCWCSTAISAKDVGRTLEDLHQNYVYFSQQYPQERVYLHFDNTSYYIGEKIWFSAEVVKGAKLEPTDISKVLYVELLSPIGIPVSTQKFKIEEGMANGAIELTDQLIAGYYEVRAFTSWMLNFSPTDEDDWLSYYEKDLRRLYSDQFLRFMKGNSGIFSRVFPVYNRVKKGQYDNRILVDPGHHSSRKINGSLRMKFFPESGQRLAGISWRVAFECRDDEGRQLNTEGDIMMNDSVIGHFNTVHDGRGVVELPAWATQNVKFCPRDNQGKTFDVPDAQKKGFGLRVDCLAPQDTKQPNEMKIEVARTSQTAGQRVGLLVSCRGEECHYREIDLTEKTSEVFSLPERGLPSGVNIVTLFDDTGRVLAEREAFVWNATDNGYRIVNVEGDTTGLRSYDQVTLKLQIQDDAGQPVRRAERFSLSVSDLSSREPTFYKNSMFTDLLLSSEVRGFIPNADYYFEQNDNQHRQALDHLLMVQGWTRYDQEQMLSGDVFEPYFEAEKGLGFHGKVLYDNDTQLMSLWRMPKEKIYIYFNFYGFAEDLDFDDEYADSMKTIPQKKIGNELYREGKSYIREVKTDKDGNFHVDLPDFRGNGLVFIMMNRYPKDLIGDNKAGTLGHTVRTIRSDTLLELDHAICPRNYMSPRAKNYDFYETALTGVTRKGTDLPKGRPNVVMDVDDMLNYSSNILGRMEMFTERPVGLTMALRGMGFNGNKVIYVNGHRENDGYYKRVAGIEEYLPINVHFYPHWADFRTIEIFADFPNRELSVGDQDGNSRMHMNKNHAWMGTLTRTISALPDSALSVFESEKLRKHIRQQVLEDDYRKSKGSTVKKNIQTVRYNYLTTDLIPAGSSLLYFTMRYNRMAYHAYAMPVEFYSPDYSMEPIPMENDYRRTLYWNPAVRTNNDGEAIVEFYNNSNCQSIHLSAEGMSTNGKTMSAE